MAGISDQSISGVRATEVMPSVMVDLDSRLDDEVTITAAANQAKAIIDGASSAGQLEDARKIVADLQSRAMRARISVPVLASLEGAIASKEAALEIEATDASVGMAGATASFQNTKHQHAYKCLSKAEKEFFDALKPNKEYLAYSVDENGNLVETSVKGHEVRDAFLELKKHSLKDALKDKESPQETMHEMDKLKQALKTSEAYHLGWLARTGQGDKAEAHHQRFEALHKEIDSIHAEAKECCNGKGNPAKLLGEQMKMRRHLQRDIIDGTMVNDDHHSHAQRGYEVAHVGDGMGMKLNNNAQQGHGPRGNGIGAGR